MSRLWSALPMSQYEAAGRTLEIDISEELWSVQDHAVANAGVAHGELLAEHGLDAWRRVLLINLTASFSCFALRCDDSRRAAGWRHRRARPHLPSRLSRALAHTEPPRPARCSILHGGCKGRGSGRIRVNAILPWRSDTLSGTMSHSSNSSFRKQGARPWPSTRWLGRPHCLADTPPRRRSLGQIALSAFRCRRDDHLRGPMHLAATHSQPASQHGRYQVRQARLDVTLVLSYFISHSRT